MDDPWTILVKSSMLHVGEETANRVILIRFYIVTQYINPSWPKEEL